MEAKSLFVALLAAVALDSAPALAQQGGNVPDMPTIAQALGVQCDYCHAGSRGAQPKPEGQPPSKFEIARIMIAMTRDLNAKILTATGKPPNEATEVTCVTCHRGIAVPGQLPDIIAKTALAQGPDAAIAQYRDLRQRYYGGQSYDFREDALLDAGQKLIRVKPQIAIPILRLNLEYYPRSVRSYAQIAFAYTRNLDDESAMTALEKALEIEPENGTIRGQLEQLKSYHRKR
jgi:tetratricopeptide (TPR) repeat protein